MSQLPHVTNSPAEQMAAATTSNPQVPAPALTTAPAQASAQDSASGPKRRSCVTCRTRKVRCDKLSPCSNCRRANIACVFPSTDRPPRWARQLGRGPNNAALGAPARVMERVKELESLVKELSSQLEQVNSAAKSSVGGSSGASPESLKPDGDADHQIDASSEVNTSNLQEHFGRLVLQDSNRSRYVSSGFWSRVDDELDGLNSDTSEDETEPKKADPTQELQRTPSERHAFLFRHNLSPSVPDLRELHPLPSQIPFLLDIFSENVNVANRMVHVATVAKMVRDLRRSDKAELSPSNEALMFSIYYTAITSMEEDDIIANFGLTKAELNLRYRLGLEHALAKADFLNAPNLTLVQAFALFLCLLRRHDSPRFVWMMTGLIIRMAHALGLHRDGEYLNHLTPYETEMRRRVWWGVCMLDMRASEDQGTDYTITRGSFDTKFPLNINDADIEPKTVLMPEGREGITEMTLPLVWCEIGTIVKQITARSTKGGGQSDVEEQSRLLSEIFPKLERGYLQYSTEPGDIWYWVSVTIARLMMAKMTLLIYLPILLSSPSEHFSSTVRTKLLIAAIEIAEYNHALNSEEACRQWRWLYQTYTHWDAIVYILIEICRRPWSPIIERAWVTLHSSWLIPSQSSADKNMLVWIPLRKLMSKAKKHRDAELERLKNDTRAAEQLEMDDNDIPMPTSPGPFSAESNAVHIFRQRWRQLVAIPEKPRLDPRTSASPGSEPYNPSMHNYNTNQTNIGSMPQYSASNMSSNIGFESTYLDAGAPPPSTDAVDTKPVPGMNPPSELAPEQTSGVSYDQYPTVTADWPYSQAMEADFVPWLWADADPSTDVFANVDMDAADADIGFKDDINWYNWLGTAKSMECEAEPNNNQHF